MTERFKIPVGVCIILRKGNKIALQLRKNTWMAGHYGLIGGHLDGNEEIKNAVIREAKEEVGIDILPADLNLKTIWHSNNDREEYLSFYFECTKWQGEIQNLENEKCARIDWIDMDNLPKNVYPTLPKVIEKIKSGILFFEDKF